MVVVCLQSIRHFKSLKQRNVYTALTERQIRENHNIFILILCPVLLCLNMKMIGAKGSINKYNRGSLLSDFKAVLLKYCLVYNSQLHKSSSIIQYFFLVELNRVTIFLGENVW